MRISASVRFAPCLLASALGCGGDSSKTITAQSLRISFAARAGTAAINCDASLTRLGLSKSTARVKDFRFFISDIEVITEDGQSERLSLDSNEWQNARLALLDFQDRADNCEGEAKSTHTEVSGTISSRAAVQGLRFRVGVPPDLNHIDIAQAQGPLNTPSLYWSWQGGYKFMRLDVAPEGGITRPSDPDFSATVYNFHLGSTNCSGDAELGQTVSCARDNRPYVALDKFDPQRDTIVLDFAKLVEGLDLSSDVKDTPGCMSEKADSECSEFFTKLGLDLTTGQAVEGQAQSVFFVE
jgi:uncharacterized repeat protein (TIGR04052 family)